MNKLRYLIFPALLTLAACGEPEHPMAGNWGEVTGSDKVGMTITFDGNSNKVNVHLAPRPDGSHGHAHGALTYTYDDATKAVTVEAELLGADKPSSWAGKVEGTKLELGAADTKLVFEKGGKPAGH